MTSRDPSTVDIKVGDWVIISCPCSGDDHEGQNHELPAGCHGKIDRIETYTNDQGLAFTVVIPVDEDRNIVNVFDELDGPIENFLTKIEWPSCGIAPEPGNTIPDNPFTDWELDQFHKEGWDIFEASGSVQNDNGDRPFQLQRLDEEAILVDDTAAWQLVWTKASAGSEPHQKALRFLIEHSPAEYAAIKEHCE